jgi:citrate lyase beta subunit
MRSFLVLADEPSGPLAADAFIVDAGLWGPSRVTAFLHAPRPAPVWVRVPSAGDARLPAVLDAVVPARPAGIVLAGAENGHDVERLSALLRPREAMAALPDRSLAVIAAVETPAALLDLATFRDAGPRLAGLLLDMAALPPGAHDHARAATLLAAAAAGTAAWLMDDGRDPDEARRAGFAGIITRADARLNAIQRA